MKWLSVSLFALVFAGSTVFSCAAGNGTGTGGSGASGGSGGSGGSCSDPAKDCPATGTACIVATCAMGACATANAPADTVCSESGGVVCDGNGACVACNGAGQCPDPPGVCATATCTNHVCGVMNEADGTPTTTGQIDGDCKVQVCDGAGNTKVASDDNDPTDDMNDCTIDTCASGMNQHTPTIGACAQNGGTVCADPMGPKAGTCVECNEDADCTVPGEVCDPSGSNLCVSVSCMDQVKNGTETDVDCGGPSCAPCPNTDACLVASDCQSGFCNALVCAPCTINANCAAADHCQAGVCTPDNQNGQACSTGTDCVSGFCADGVCCDTACTGVCNACTGAKKGQGLDGVCGPIAVGNDPDSECATDPTSTCQKNGACNGAGACQLYVAGTVCAPQSCSLGVQSNADLCNGAGTCVDSGGASCGAYACNAAGTACLTMCSLDTDCALGNYCSAGTCTPKLSNGSVCSTAGQCTSGLCVDGFCCNNACSSVCQACSAAKTGGANGTCGNVASNTDPDNECAGTDVCNGMGQCAKPLGAACSAGAQCLSGNCVDGVCCNNACVGLCLACSAAKTGGANGTCGNVSANTDPDAECAGPDVCNGGGACIKGLGSSCSANGECQTGNCIDGVCCNTSCTGLCQACNVAGSLGTCTPIPAGQDPANECAGAVTCNGAGACGLGGNGAACAMGAECLSGFCVDGVCCSSACSGLCQACNVAGSVGSCANLPAGSDPANECTGAQTCNGAGACVGAGNGTACTFPTDCASGFCVDGFCCNTGCGGACQACDVSGSVGSCVAIAAGQDPANECSGTYSCNGAFACQGCSDATKNGNETGTDCGGGTCAACPVGQGCNVNSDCLTNNCVGGFCQAAGTCSNGTVEAGEGCDDANLANNDGCNSACQCEATQIVTADPSPDLAIPDDTYTGTIASMACVNLVAKAQCTITSMTVQAFISHTWIGDLVIKLVHPDNTVVTLMIQPGALETTDDGLTGGVGDSSNLSNSFPITFQMGAAVSAENMGATIGDTQVVCLNDAICTFAPSSGAAAPGDLNTFIGKKANGTWKFCVGDKGALDTGVIDRVTLNINQ